MFRVIASEQADWESSIFHCIPFRLYEIYSTKCIYYFFNEQNIIYKNKFQKRSVINYLALHKNLWCWTQKHIWTIYSIKTELQFHFISITILLEDTNAPTHKILCHRYFSTCGKPEPINISWGFPNVSHIWKKRQMTSNGKKQNKTYDLIPIKSWFNEWHSFWHWSRCQMEQSTSWLLFHWYFNFQNEEILEQAGNKNMEKGLILFRLSLKYSIEANKLKSFLKIVKLLWPGECRTISLRIL